MTKFILHGGKAQKPDERNDSFFKEILKDTPNNISILLVHFAGEPEKIEINKERDISQFNRVKENKNITYKFATENDFLSQISSSDIIYFGGGTTVRLLSVLSKFPDLKNAIEGKIVAGESAGANIWAAYCFSKSGGGIIKCLGILPIKTFPHYTGEDLNELENIRPDLKTLPLNEYEYVIF